VAIAVAVRARFVGLIQAGLRCGVRRWTALGVLWLLLTLAGWVLAAVEPSGNDGEGLAGGLIILAWCGGIVTSLAIRRGQYAVQDCGHVQATI
jgi:hypothetical protein